MDSNGRREGLRLAPRSLQIAIVLIVAACQAAPAASPGDPATVAPTLPPAMTSPTPPLVPVPDGRIAFLRQGADGAEQYFTISSDGTDEQPLFSAEHCGCLRWSADGSRVLSLAPSDAGIYSLMTIRPDGTDRVVIPAPVDSLNLAVGATSADGEWLAFNGWDEQDPSNSGLYLARPDLTELKLVLPLQDGMLATEPFGLTPDASKILFFAETGPENGVTHAGDVYVVDADGSNLRQLNPPGSRSGMIGPPAASLAPDGRQAAFAAGGFLYVADLESGEAKEISSRAGVEWAVTWSPTGEWIAFTVNAAGVNSTWLVRPDGKEIHRIPSNPSGRGSWPAWSPDGTVLLVRNEDVGRSDNTDLWVMDLDGNWVGQVTHQPSSYGFHSWAPGPG
jgi:Tol biopolymer transport system component